MNEIWQGITTVLLAIVGVAIVAALVSPNAKTAQVVQAGGGAFATSLGAALAPVSGGLGSFAGTGQVSVL